MSDRKLTITTSVKDLASKELSGLGKTGKKAGGSIAASFIKAQIAIALFKTAVRTASRFVRSMTTEIADQGDKIQKMALRLGIGTEALSRFEHVAKLAGVEFRQFAIALQRQGRRIGEAAVGMGEAQKALVELERYGLPAAKELSRLAPEDQFLALADALEQVEGGADRLRLAFKLWDSEGVKNLQIINAGTDALREQMKEAEKYGIVWSEANAKMAAAFKDSQTRLDAAFTGIKMAISKKILPPLTKLFTKLSNILAENREKIAKSFVKLVDVVGNSLISIAEELIVYAIKVDFFFSKAIDSSQMDRRIKKVRQLAAAARAAMEDVKDWADANATATKRLDEMTVRASHITTFLDDYKAGMKEASAVTVTFAKDLGAATVQSTLGNFSSALDAVIDKTKSWKEAFRDMVKGIIKDLIRLAAQRALLAAFNQTSGGAGFAGLFSSGEAPSKQHGGVFTRPTTLRVGEAGPEAVVPLSKAGSGAKSITINQTVYSGPGMDAQDVADLAAATFRRELRTSVGFRGAIRKTAREGLY